MSGAVLVAALALAQTPPPVDYQSDRPPPTAWDKQQEADGAAPTTPAPEDGVSLLAQLAKTTVSLLLVIGLIYLFSRFALPRLLAMRPAGKSGKVVTVVERVPLDQKNALVVIDLHEGPRLLLASGEKGVQLLGDLASLGNRDGFREAMTRAADRQREEEGGHA
jgi:flagellar biogenesis protein FliO